MSVGTGLVRTLIEQRELALRAFSMPAAIRADDLAPAATTIRVPAGAVVAFDWQRAGRAAATTQSLSADEHIELILWLCRVDDPPSVTAFVRGAPFLGGVLLESLAKIQQYFSERATVSLRVFTDQDVDLEPELLLLVRTKLAPEQALACLGAFDRDWWLDAVRTARGKLTIDVEYE